MKTLVTGGAGFVGSHLVEHLLAAGDEVTVLDDLSTGSIRNLLGLQSHPRLNIVFGSILRPRSVREAIAGCDRVFHLAAVVGVKLIVEQPLRGLRVNLHGTENVLDAAVGVGASVLLVSTSEIYGKNTADSLHEESDRILGSPLASRWTYAAAKGLDESFARAYVDEFGLDVSIVRLFNTVGPRQTGRYGMVVPNLVGQAVRGVPLTVFGDGTQSRCFSYVGDVVPAMVQLAEHEHESGQAFNLGGAHEVSIVDLAERIVARLDSQSAIEFIPYDVAYSPGFEDMRRRVPDNTKARLAVGYHPATSLNEIIDLVAAGIQKSGTRPDDLMSIVGATTTADL
ncbi:UDP-glucose 4-epimerase [Pseudoclavibacter sp. JAI123]|uniref:NAD-dependent epimerase/dehydratase family protein n=1 Tax=Pseudoclavibacter sp. JAI123 TaxID=2723065 RepID=UPI0015CB36F8|nr:NAD-dependent epimerase/dehydratase family protein [Pseudoclavibacter sp. JAI123]NYF12063.1 UDP-glucose 4-epimerase [Pseudoclavibacter sp. JAI123]